jgi:hypothetical protein
MLTWIYVRHRKVHVYACVYEYGTNTICAPLYALAPSSCTQRVCMMIARCLHEHHTAQNLYNVYPYLREKMLKNHGELAPQHAATCYWEIWDARESGMHAIHHPLRARLFLPPGTLTYLDCLQFPGGRSNHARKSDVPRASQIPDQRGFLTLVAHNPSCTS